MIGFKINTELRKVKKSFAEIFLCESSRLLRLPSLSYGEARRSLLACFRLATAKQSG